LRCRLPETRATRPVDSMFRRSGRLRDVDCGVPEASGQVAGQLSVFVVDVADMPDTEWYARQDPYVVAKIGTGKSRRTKAKSESRQRARWMEDIVLDVTEDDLKGTLTVLIELRDGHFSSRDKLIGRTTLDLDRVVRYHEPQSGRHQLYNQSRNAAGKLKLDLTFHPTQPTQTTQVSSPNAQPTEPPPVAPLDAAAFTPASLPPGMWMPTPPHSPAIPIPNLPPRQRTAHHPAPGPPGTTSFPPTPPLYPAQQDAHPGYPPQPQTHHHGAPAPPPVHQPFHAPPSPGTQTPPGPVHHASAYAMHPPAQAGPMPTVQARGDPTAAVAGPDPLVTLAGPPGPPVNYGYGHHGTPPVAPRTPYRIEVPSDYVPYGGSAPLLSRSSGAASIGTPARPGGRPAVAGYSVQR